MEQWWRGTLMWAAVGLVALVGVVFLVLQPLGVSPEEDNSPSLPGDFFPSQGDLQLGADQTFMAYYSSNPPTSGPYAPTPVDWGIFDQPQPTERLVHNMALGGVIIWYNCPRCEDIINRLKAITQEYQEKGKRIVLTPYPNMEARIAVTSWTRMLKMNQINEDAIRRFIEVHERRYNPKGL